MNANRLGEKSRAKHRARTKMIKLIKSSAATPAEQTKMIKQLQDLLFLVS